jgi:hypothetical protein
MITNAIQTPFFLLLDSFYLRIQNTRKLQKFNFDAS